MARAERDRDRLTAELAAMDSTDHVAFAEAGGV